MVRHGHLSEALLRVAVNGVQLGRSPQPAQASDDDGAYFGARAFDRSPDGISA